MTRTRSWLRFVVLGLLVAAVAPPTMAKAKRHFPLRYQKTESDGGKAIDLTGVSGTILKVEPARDTREKVAEIGVNLEDDDKGPLPVTTDSDVAGFVTDVLRQELRGVGIALDGGTPTRILNSEVVEFRVTLDGKYMAEVKLKVRVTDTEGKELYAGLAQGSAQRFSMRESPDNYRETLSDALHEALSGLVHHESFLLAMKS